MYVLLLPIMTTRKFYTHFQAWNSLKQYSETKAEEPTRKIKTQGKLLRNYTIDILVHLTHFSVGQLKDDIELYASCTCFPKNMHCSSYSSQYTIL